MIALLGTAAWQMRPLPAPRITEIRPVTKGLGAPPGSMLGSASWATDGVRLYYVSQGQTQDRPRLYQIPVTGGEAVEIPLPVKASVSILGGTRRVSPPCS